MFVVKPCESGSLQEIEGVLALMFQKECKCGMQLTPPPMITSNVFVVDIMTQNVSVDVNENTV